MRKRCLRHEPSLHVRGRELRHTPRQRTCRRPLHGFTLVVLVVLVACVSSASAASGDNTPPQGFVALFNGRDLSGWKGLVEDPQARGARAGPPTGETHTTGAA